jgi:hypothetical protein
MPHGSGSALADLNEICKPVEGERLDQVRGRVIFRDVCNACSEKIEGIRDWGQSRPAYVRAILR